MLRVADHYAGTDTGRQRRANEDSLLARTPLFVVADGMGGAQAGEVASRIAVDCFRPGLQDGSDPEGALAAQALAANARIHELSQSNVEQAGMGTTLTALYVGEEEVAVAQVGDSRAYCLRDGELLRLTDDHSLVDELIRQGKLTPEEANEHPQRSIITRALGPEATVEVDTRSFRARAGDLYLLCSDGLTTMLSEQDVLRTLLAHSTLREAGEGLIAAANEAGGRDNITVVLLRLEEVGQSHPSTSDATTLTGVPAVAGGIADEATIAGIPSMDVQRPAAIPQELAVAVRGRSAAAPAPVRRRRPRMPGSSERPGVPQRRRRGLRRGTSLVALTLLGLLAASAYLATQSIYFIGTNEAGLVTVYNGLPYELPGGLKLYSREYVSGVSASTLSASRRHTLLDDSLRSETNAVKAIRQLELAGQDGG